MQIGAVVIHGNAQCQLAGIGFVQAHQPRLHGFTHHRAHGIGQDQHVISGGQRGFGDLDHLRVHERLTAGKGNLCHRPVALRDLPQIIAHLVGGDIDQRIIRRAGRDIAVHAFNVAQGAGVEPQRLRVCQADSRAGFALGRQGRILKFTDICVDNVFHRKPDLTCINYFSLSMRMVCAIKPRVIWCTDL